MRHRPARPLAGASSNGRRSLPMKDHKRTAAPANFADLWSADRDRQNHAFHEILELTSRPVDWADEVWDGVVANLAHTDNHNRAIAAQVLCNLARSDGSQRMLEDFPALFAVTGDERFVTAR